MERDSVCLERQAHSAVNNPKLHQNIENNVLMAQRTTTNGWGSLSFQVDLITYSEGKSAGKTYRRRTTTAITKTVVELTKATTHWSGVKTKKGETTQEKIMKRKGNSSTSFFVGKLLVKSNVS